MESRLARPGPHAACCMQRPSLTLPRDAVPPTAIEEPTNQKHDTLLCTQPFLPFFCITAPINCRGSIFEPREGMRDKKKTAPSWLETRGKRWMMLPRRTARPQPRPRPGHPPADPSPAPQTPAAGPIVPHRECRRTATFGDSTTPNRTSGGLPGKTLGLQPCKRSWLCFSSLCC
jgi:hypothetical protein